MTAIETLAKMYADQFVNRFSHIEGHWQEPLISPSSHPHQNISGNAYRGCNRSFLPLIATFRGLRLPLWMTAAQMQDLSVWPQKGSSSVPVSFTDIYIRESETGARSRVTVEEFDGMTADQRREKGLQKIYLTRWYRVFNIEQTTFADKYPEAMAEIARHFGADDVRRVDSDILDRMVSDDIWLCPIIVDGMCIQAAYDRDRDAVTVPPKCRFADDRAYYGALLREMARSTGSELRLDRGIWSDLGGDVAREALVSELSAASMGALLGLGVTMDASSERFLKSWIEDISASPQFIYEAVKESARATDCLCNVLGLDMAKGIDIVGIVARQDEEKARKAIQNRQERIRKRDGLVSIPRGRGASRRK